MLMFWHMYYRWILFIGAVVLIGIGNSIRTPSSYMIEKESRHALSGKQVEIKGDVRPGGCLLILLGIICLIAWIVSFVGVTF